MANQQSQPVAAVPPPILPAPTVPNGHGSGFPPYSVPQSYQPNPPVPHPAPSPAYPTVPPPSVALPPNAQAMLAAIPDDQRVGRFLTSRCSIELILEC